MKLVKKTTTTYWKTYEYTTPGTYTLTVPKNTACKLILVGGGGGGSASTSGFPGTWTAAGGSAGMVTGSSTIDAGIYTIVVGEHGIGRTRSGGNQTGTDGGDSTAFGNIAGGGGGGKTYLSATSGSSTPGVAGTATTTTGFTGTNGVAGSTTSRYGTYGGGGAAGANNGQDGYCKIELALDSSDYDYTEDETVCYAVKGEEEIKLVPNVTVAGSPTINNGVVSEFSTSNYLLVDNKYRSNNNGEYIVKFTTGTNVSTMQRVLHCEYFLCFQFESGRFMGYNWQRNDRTYLINCLANTTYWFKFIANGTSRTYAYSLDGSNWTTILTETDTSMDPSSSYRLTLGTSSKDHSGPFLGSIDLNECYIKINGETWWTGMREEVRYTYKGVK